MTAQWVPWRVLQRWNAARASPGRLTLDASVHSHAHDGFHNFIGVYATMKRRAAQARLLA